jgi:hypothetical protein
VVILLTLTGLIDSSRPGIVNPVPTAVLLIKRRFLCTRDAGSRWVWAAQTVLRHRESRICFACHSM